MSNHNFRAIQTFVNDLGETFSDELHSLALYERLINKTTTSHTEAIEKHVACFRVFLEKNETNILNRTLPFIGLISYSQKVFIDMNAVFGIKMDDETKDTIWKHLLTLSAIIANSTGARDVLKDLAKNKAVETDLVKFEGGTPEEDFLNNIISKVGSHVESSEVADPQLAIGNIMNSSLIPDIVTNLNSEISSGKLDIGKMINSVQKMVGNMSGGEIGNDPNIANAMGMLTNMMGMMKQ